MKERVMRKLILLCTLLCAMALAISASPARAQSVLWVSATGNDANACSQAAPCLTFQGAINKGNVAQINCLTGGSYGVFVITASITVDCGTGNIGTIFATAGNAITINTGPGVIVVLRHLSLNGDGSATNGIDATAFASGTLIVEDCMIQGFQNGYGITFGPQGGRGLLQVSNSQMFDNNTGIQVAPASGQVASVTLNRVELVANSSTGLYLNDLNGLGIVAGTMRHSVVGENGTHGVRTFASQVYFTVEESSIVANLATGIITQSAGSVVNVGASTIGGHGTGVHSAAGSLISFGNNQMSANGVNGSFTATTPLQ
jgi:hypothetical protein